MRLLRNRATARDAERATAFADAAAAAGASAFVWRRDLDRLSLMGPADALGLGDLGEGATWRAFAERFASPDREALTKLSAPFVGQRAVVARLTHPQGDVRRLRLRAGWTSADVLTGLILPAFGAAGEASDEADEGALSLEVRLRRAVKNRDFAAWYQPIVSLKDTSLAGFEALLRWPTQEHGLLGPDDFLPLADELSLMPEIGSWIHAEACARLSEWRGAFGPRAPGFVSANASAPELEDATVVDAIAGLVADPAIPSGALRIEVTESHVMRDPDRMRVTLEAVKAAGASLALDDFGAGFSSLAWLERFPFDVVKVDRYFVRSLGSSAGSRKIFGSIIEISHALGMTVVAEGVETREEAARVRDSGCDYGQGFWFAPALTAEEVSHLLSQESG